MTPTLRVSLLSLTAGLVACQAPGQCPKTLHGTTAFARELSTTATFLGKDGGQELKREELTLEVYFPEGRVSGGRVIFARRKAGFAVAASALVTGDLGATVPALGWTEDGWPKNADPGAPTDVSADIALAGKLVGPDQGLAATLSAEIFSGDVGWGSATASPTYCNEGRAPEVGTLTTPGSRPSPLSQFEWSSNVPLDPQTIPRAPLLLNGVPVAVSIATAWTSFGVRPIQPLPPGVTPTLDLAGVRDVLGRPLSQPVTTLPPALATTEVVQDLSFMTLPPAGAIATDGAEPFLSNMYREPRELSFSSTGAYEALIALGDPGAVTMATIRIASSCRQSGAPSVLTVALVGTSGVASMVPISCGGSSGELPEVAVPVPSSGPLWLAVRNTSRRCFFCQEEFPRLGAVRFQ